MSSYIVLSVIFIGISISLCIYSIYTSLMLSEEHRSRKLRIRRQKFIQEVARLSSLQLAEIEAIIRVADAGMMSLDEAADALMRRGSFAIQVAPTPPKYCSGCKYYYGDRGIVCAVHPTGVESDTCLDFET